MNIGIHHFIQNYRLPDKNSPILKDRRFQKIINGGVYVAAMLSLSATIPQIMKIWIDRNAEGVSVATWTGFTVSSLFWLIYGLIHRDKAIVLASAGAIVANLIIIVGTLIFS